MPFDATGNWTGNYMLTPGETEEERRRRLGLPPTDVAAPQPMAPAQPVQPTAAPAPQPAPQPAPAAPVSPDQFRYENFSPEQISNLEQRMGTMGINDRGILRRPDAAEMFNARPLNQRQQLFEASQGGMQRTAAPAAQPPAPAPAAQPAPTPTAQPVLGTGITAPAAQQAPAPTDYMSLLQGSQVNEKVRNRLITDPNTPPDVRRAALANERAALTEQKERTEAEQRARDIIERGDGLAFAREMKKEGSLLRAIFFGYGGAQDLARNELNMLGYGGKWDQATNDKGERALIKYRADGMPMEGYDETGRALSAKEIAGFGAYGVQGKVTTSGTFFQTPNGQILRAQSTERGLTRLVDASTGAVYTGPTNNLMKLEEAGAYRKMDYALVTDLKKKHGNNVLEAEKEYVALNGPFRTNEARQEFRQAYGFQEAMPPTPTPSTAMTPPQGAGPVAPQPVTPLPAAQPAAPVSPQQLATIPPAGAGPALSPTISSLPTSNVTVPLAEQQRQAGGAKIQVEEQAKDIADYRAKQGRVEDNADYLITKIEELATHPGMETSVGAKGPSYLFGLIDAPLPPQLGGGDARDFLVRLGEVEGQAFLQAFETLRGGGQISNVEGEKATNAITRMKQAATEREFRAAANDFIGIVKRGVDRGRKKLGQEPVYGEPRASERSRAAPGTRNNPIKLD